jgi:hypothetical protein
MPPTEGARRRARSPAGSDDGAPTAADFATRARRRWLSATNTQQMKTAEVLLRRALDAAAAHPGGTDAEDVDQWQSWLLLLLCQSARDKAAGRRLQDLDYVARLAPSVLDYGPEDKALTSASVGTAAFETLPLLAKDTLVATPVLQLLQSVFSPSTAHYWTDHSYTVEPPSPYFSYVVPLNATAGLGAIGAFVDQVYETAMAAPFVQKKIAAGLSKQPMYAELWAHNRPHACGHQMHFDSDDEGRGGIRNPVIGSVFFMSENAGGPTVVTNQPFKSTKLGTHGWSVHPKENRLVVFDGCMLHGVVPGKGPSQAPSAGGEHRRVTLMCALWHEIKQRPGVGPAAARPFPSAAASPWVTTLTAAPTKRATDSAAPRNFIPQQIAPLWAKADGTEWPVGGGMPHYNHVFQGF